MISDLIAKWVIFQAVTGLAGLFGSSQTFGLTNPLASASPGVPVPQGPPQLARGGITRGVSIAGEAGPEAVVPLPDGRSIPVDIQGVNNRQNYQIEPL